MAKARFNTGNRNSCAKYAGYTYGYNYPLFAQRVHDILSAVSFVRHNLGARRVYLVGLGGAGHWVLAARAQAGTAIDRAVADTDGFRFAKLTALDDPDFLPGGAKYLDLPGIAALSAPQPLWLGGEGTEMPPVVAAAYRASGATDALASSVATASEQEAAALHWLLK